jgi:drug/metabolite transporter (DMT)-like permease
MGTPVRDEKTAAARKRRRTWPSAWRTRAAVLSRRAGRLHPTVRGIAWSVVAGVLFCMLNALMRGLTLQVDPFQTQFLRYLMGLVVMLPLIIRSGFAAYWPQNVGGQFARGAVHTFGLCLWFLAVPHITLADTTAIAFTTPIFIMLGAALVLREPMRWERWFAAFIGFGGVLLVVAPKLTGSGGLFVLVMLASCPIFAASFLMTKSLTRYERPAVIVVWQTISVAALSLPLALLNWKAPTFGQWVAFAACGVLGSTGHYCLTRSFMSADISATQSAKFLDLMWASILGWMVFADKPSQSTLIGGVVICASTLWIARREARDRAPA